MVLGKGEMNGREMDRCSIYHGSMRWLRFFLSAPSFEPAANAKSIAPNPGSDGMGIAVPFKASTGIVQADIIRTERGAEKCIFEIGC